MRVSWSEQVPKANPTPYRVYDDVVVRKNLSEDDKIDKSFDGVVQDYIYRGQGDVHAVILCGTMLLDRPLHELTVLIG